MWRHMTLTILSLKWCRILLHSQSVWSYDLESSLHPIQGTLVHHLPGHALTSPAPSSPAASSGNVSPKSLRVDSCQSEIQGIPKHSKVAKKKQNPNPNKISWIFFTARKFRKQKHPKSRLVGGFNPFEKYARQNGKLPQIGVKIKNIWNHHPAVL